MYDDYVHRDQVKSYVLDEGLLDADDITEWVEYASIEELSSLSNAIATRLIDLHFFHLTHTHLCTQCIGTQGNCLGKPLYGLGKNKDNVVECNRYQPPVKGGK